MLPLALKLEEGGESRAPMAVVIMGGVISSTLLTLVLVRRLHDPRRRQAGRRQADPAHPVLGRARPLVDRHRFRWWRRGLIASSLPAFSHPAFGSEAGSLPVRRPPGWRASRRLAPTRCRCGSHLPLTRGSG